jgi:hypothetical protein
MRSYAAQDVLIATYENSGTDSLLNYTNLIAERLYKLVTPALNLLPLDELQKRLYSSDSNTNMINRNRPLFKHAESTQQIDDILIELLLSEAQGGVRVLPKLSDLLLSCTALSTPLSASHHFKIGIRLSKLSLYDLAQKHVSISATPWDPFYYRLRYVLSLPPVYSSLRALALSVNNFEDQIEKYLLRGSLKSHAVSTICESFDESSFVLGVLPLLHLTGYSAPRHEALMGYSPIAMPVLLSEFYVSMCSPGNFKLSISQQPPNRVVSFAQPVKKIRIGVVSGTFDSLSGRIVVGELIILI